MKFKEKLTNEKSKWRIERLVSDEILDRLDLKFFYIYVNCIKRKQTNKMTFEANRTFDVLELIHTYILGYQLWLLEMVNNIL